jgi:hypothetical protein
LRRFRLRFGGRTGAVTDSSIHSHGAPDFEAILYLARRKAEATRDEYRAVMTALFEARRAVLTDRQRALMNNLLHQLVHDIESALNRLLLARIEGESWIARETLEAMHRDASADTFERLAAAGLLSDLALIEAIAHRLYEHQLDRALNVPAQQGWPGTVGTVHDDQPEALLPVADRPVLDALHAYAVDRSLRMDPYGNPVIDVAELEPDLQERLHWMVAAVLRENLLKLAPYRQSEIDILVEETVASSRAGFASGALPVTRAAAVAETVERAGRLDCALVVEALRRGEVPLFEALLIRLTGLRPVLMRRLLYEPGGEGLAVAVRAVGMTRDEFAELYALTRHARPGHSAAADNDAKRALAFFDRIPEDQAGLVHDYWCRDPRLLTALWRLHGDSGDRAPGPH